MLKDDKGMFHELKVLNSEASCSYHSNGLGRIGTVYFAGKSEISLVTVIVGNSKCVRENVCIVVFSWLRRTERALYLEQKNFVG